MAEYDIFDVWVKLMTLDGKYKLCDVEIAFRNKHDIFERHRRHTSLQAGQVYTNWKYVPEKHSNDIWKTPFVFNTTQELRKYCMRNKPKSIEMGAVYFDPGKKFFHSPLIFDVDADEYDKYNMRKCACVGKKQTCNQCWKNVMVPAMNELHNKLTNVFGFKNLMTIFSGRRGFHIWVLDDKVWSYTCVQRRAIFNQFEAKLDKPVTVDPKHLVKLPLMFHPATKKRAKPIDNTFLPETNDDGNIDDHMKLILKKIKFKQ